MLKVFLLGDGGRFGYSRIGLCFWSLGLLAVAAPTIAAADDLNPPSERWQSSVDFSFETEIEERDTAVRGTVAPRQATSQLGSTAFRLGYQGLAPPIEGLWGKPRPFIRGGLKFMYVSETEKAGTYSGSGPEMDLQELINIDEIRTGNPNASRQAFALVDADDFDSGFEAEFRNNPIPGVYAGLGFAFDRIFPSPNLPGWLSIKTGIDYSLRRYTIRGAVAEVTEETPDIFTVTRQQDTMSWWEHRIGPSVEVEIGLRDRKDFAMSLFFAARAHFLVSRAIHTWGNTDGIRTTVWDFESATPGDSSGKVIRFRSDAQPLLLSLGGGIRLYWFGGP